ncbi:MAG: adenosylcobinamide-GDP ribazoletransferase [Chloroflexi bacterium]|nr:adenosylcobinamide-GDP ribazoletransferase [Chloroflexota bacterium]
MNDFLTALGLLTIVPARYREPISARAYAWFPFVGLLIGASLVVAHFLLRAILPNLVASALLLALWIVFSGALHLDGFADACDGLFAATTRERRLEILRDVHLGTFGAVGLMLLLIVKFAALANVSSFAPILLAPILGRWAMVFAATFPLARSGGMAALFRAGLTRRIVFVATMFAALGCAFFGAFGFAALVGAFLVALSIARLALNRLGGLTGDIYGMICESVEAGVLLIGCVTL